MTSPNLLLCVVVVVSIMVVAYAASISYKAWAKLAFIEVLLKSLSKSSFLVVYAGTSKWVPVAHFVMDGERT